MDLALELLGSVALDKDLEKLLFDRLQEAI